MSVRFFEPGRHNSIPITLVGRVLQTYFFCRCVGFFFVSLSFLASCWFLNGWFGYWILLISGCKDRRKLLDGGRVMSLVREGGRRVFVFGSARWVLAVEMERAKRWRLEGTALLYVYEVQYVGSRMHVVSKPSYSIFYSTSFFIIPSDRFVLSLHERFGGMGVALFEHLPVIHGIVYNHESIPHHR